MELSQIAVDIIGYCAVFLLWFPLLGGLIALLIFVMYATIQDEHLKKDYFKSLSDEDRKVVLDYLENTNYLRVKRRLRRIKKNLIRK